MDSLKTFNTRKILAGLNYSGLDRIYQQLDSELGIILTLHHVRPDPVPEFAPNAHLAIHPEFLESAVQLLKRRNFEFVSMDEARQRIVSGDRSNRFAAVTFDDGYRNTVVHAVPVLQKYNVPYIIYVAPGFVEKFADLWWDGIEIVVRQQDRVVFEGQDWKIDLDCSTLAKKHEAFSYLLKYMTVDTPELQQRDRVRKICKHYNVDLDAILEREILSWEEMKRADQDPLCTIGAHTLHHLSLARLDKPKAHTEMIESAALIEAEIGHRPVHFAYPYGYRAAAASREFELMRETNYQTAVTTRAGMVFPEHAEHLTALPRISVNGLFQHLRYFAPLTTGLPSRLSTRMKKLDVT